MRAAAPWNHPTKPAWIFLQQAVTNYAKLSAANGLTPERVMAQLASLFEKFPRDADRETRLRAALIAFVLDSYFRKSRLKSGTTRHVATFGRFYYGHHCMNCTQFMPRVEDQRHGVGRPTRRTSRAHPVEKLRCDSCSHESFYWVSSMERQQV